MDTEELRQELQIGVDALARGESQDLDTAIDAIRQKCAIALGCWRRKIGGDVTRRIGFRG